jgi:Arc/MetJ-type ribon-helix-helix transcriptional regulator
MVKGSKDSTERINFELHGELAIWLQEMKERGIFNSSPEAVRLAIIVLRYHFNILGIHT